MVRYSFNCIFNPLNICLDRVAYILIIFYLTVAKLLPPCYWYLWFWFSGVRSWRRATFGVYSHWPVSMVDMKTWKVNALAVAAMTCKWNLTLCKLLVLRTLSNRSVHVYVTVSNQSQISFYGLQLKHLLKIVLQFAGKKMMLVSYILHFEVIMITISLMTIIHLIYLLALRNWIFLFTTLLYF